MKWLDCIQTLIESNSDSNLLIGGDLNDVFIPQLDRYRCKPGVVQTDYVRSWKIACDEFNLVDIWRMMNPNLKCYSWRQGKSAKNLKQSRLDWFQHTWYMTWSQLILVTAQGLIIV